MQRGSGGTIFEPVQQPGRRDREVTLGPFMLTMLGCFLFALCGLCFVFGYAVGHSNAESSTAISVPPRAPILMAQSGNSQPKRSAGQGGGQPQAAPAGETATGEIDPGTGAVETSSSGAITQAADPAIHTVAASQPGAVQSGGTVQAALSTQAGATMVQIAAVTHPEDADVLVGALRKRGYAVSARRDPADGLLHVEIGPFTNRDEAYAMRQKLLNDGYNAIVQP